MAVLSTDKGSVELVQVRAPQMQLSAHRLSPYLLGDLPLHLHNYRNNRHMGTHAVCLCQDGDCQLHLSWRYKLAPSFRDLKP
jgi:hypothetical protein